MRATSSGTSSAWHPSFRSASRALPAALLARFRARHARRIRADGLFQLSSQRHRERERNVADCLAKLAALLAEVATPPK